MGVKFKVKGDNIRRRGKAAMNDARSGARAAVRESVEAIRDDERDRAPLGTPSTLRGSGEPGELRDSIREEIAADGLSGTVGVSGEAAEYAEFVEHGTSAMEAQPFAQPAAEAERSKFTRRVTDEIREALG